jgi:hypothetical protein
MKAYHLCACTIFIVIGSVFATVEAWGGAFAAFGFLALEIGDNIICAIKEKGKQ